MFQPSRAPHELSTNWASTVLKKLHIGQPSEKISSHVPFDIFLLSVIITHDDPLYSRLESP